MNATSFPRPPKTGSHRALGFTLPEMLLALGLTAIVATGVFVLYTSSPAAAGADIEQGNVDQIAQTAYRAYGPLGTYRGVTTATAITDGVIPSGMVRAGGHGPSTAASVWNTPVTLSSAPAAGIADAGLAITYASVPKGACTTLVSGVADGMWDVQINGVSIMKDVSAGGRQLPGQNAAAYRVMDYDTAQAQCLQGGKKGQDPNVVFIRYDATVGSQLTAGADSRNLLWDKGSGTKGDGGLGGVVTPGGDTGGGKGDTGGGKGGTNPVVPPVFGS